MRKETVALIQTVLDILISRRSFLKGSAAAIGIASFALNVTALPSFLDGATGPNMLIKARACALEAAYEEKHT